MGDKSPKAKNRAKKQDLRSKNEKKVAAQTKSPQPNVSEAPPKAS
jgi:hypothetical protein